MYDWADRHKLYIFFCNIVLINSNTNLWPFHPGITPVEIVQTVSQVKPKCWKCISWTRHFQNVTMLLLTKSFNHFFLYHSVWLFSCWLHLMITYRSLYRLLKKRQIDCLKRATRKKSLGNLHFKSVAPRVLRKSDFSSPGIISVWLAAHVQSVNTLPIHSSILHTNEFQAWTQITCRQSHELR